MSSDATAPKAAAGMDIRRVAELVRQLAEARQEVRHLTASLSEKEKLISRTTESNGNKKSRKNRRDASATAQSSSCSSSASRSTSSNTSSSSSSSAPVVGESRVRAGHPLSSHREKKSRDDNARGHERSKKRDEKKSRRHHSHVDRRAGKAAELWKQRYITLRDHHRSEIARRDAELGEIQLIIDQIDLAHEHARLEREQSQLQQRVQNSIVIPWASAEQSGISDGNTRVVHSNGNTTNNIASTDAAAALPLFSSPLRVACAGCGASTASLSQQLASSVPPPHRCQQPNLAAGLNHSALVSEPMSPSSGPTSETIHQLQQEVSSWKEKCLQLLLEKEQPHEKGLQSSSSQQQQHTPQRVASDNIIMDDGADKASLSEAPRNMDHKALPPSPRTVPAPFPVMNTTVSDVSPLPLPPFYQPLFYGAAPQAPLYYEAQGHLAPHTQAPLPSWMLTGQHQQQPMPPQQRGTPQLFDRSAGHEGARKALGGEDARVPSHVSLQARGTLAQPGASRSKLQGDIARNDQLLAAIAKLQHTASEHTSRVPR